MPLTFATFTLGVAAIIGFPFLAGFFSKDAILYLAFKNNTAVFGLLALTAILTSFYMVRLWKITFLGAPRSDAAGHAHEGGLTLTAPLVVLAVLSVIGGYTAIYPKVFSDVFDLIPVAHGPDHNVILITSLAVTLIGAAGALAFYANAATDSLQQKSPGVFGALTALQFSFDRGYDYYVAKVQQRFALFLNFLEQIFLAGLIVRGLAGIVGLVGLGARGLHVGRLNVYLYWFLLGLVILWIYATEIF